MILLCRKNTAAYHTIHKMVKLMDMYPILLYTLHVCQFVKLQGYNLPEYHIIYGIIWLHGHATVTNMWGI
jgi:hypothetical protein